MNTFNLMDVFIENYLDSRVITARRRDTIKHARLDSFFKLLESLIPMILSVKSENSDDRLNHSQVILSLKTSEFKIVKGFCINR